MMHGIFRLLVFLKAQNSVGYQYMISREEVNKMATLARLELDEAQKESLVKDLGNILGYMDLLKEAEGGGGASTPSVDGTIANHMAPNIMRADKVTNETGELSAKLVEAAPKHNGQYVRVKKIL
jgi:aspartyl-tRNA(Asn)/glutamyl-tRNA(Gln) amidotransferase subunit C